MALIVAGDVRTNWVVGDVAPEGGEVALPRLGWMAVMVGLALLAWHQVRARRSLPEDRYRGPSILVLLGLDIGVSVLLVLPVRGSINLLFEGGIPDWQPLVIWMVAGQVTFLVIAWLVMVRGRAMPGLRLVVDRKPIRHALIGVGAGALTQAAVLSTALLIEEATPVRIFQIWGERTESIAPPGVPLLLVAVISVGLAPVAEEIFFRGLVLSAWLREYGPWAALVGSAILFGLVHYGLNPIEGFLPELPRLALLSAGGLVLGLLAIRTGSLIAPTAAHATMNSVILLLGLLQI